jgi:hypothetical protein
MHLQVCGGEEKGGNTCVRSLASPHLAGPGRAGRGLARRGDGRGRTMCMSIVHQNLAQSLVGPHSPFAVYFAMSPCLIRLIEIDLVGYGTL